MMCSSEKVTRQSFGGAVDEAGLFVDVKGVEEDGVRVDGVADDVSGLAEGPASPWRRSSLEAALSRGEPEPRCSSEWADPALRPCLASLTAWMAAERRITASAGPEPTWPSLRLNLGSSSVATSEARVPPHEELIEAHRAVAVHVELRHGELDLLLGELLPELRTQPAQLGRVDLQGHPACRTEEASARVRASCLPKLGGAATPCSARRPTTRRTPGSSRCRRRRCRASLVALISGGQGLGRASGLGYTLTRAPPPP